MCAAALYVVRIEHLCAGIRRVGELILMHSEMHTALSYWLNSARRLSMSELFWLAIHPSTPSSDALVRIPCDLHGVAPPCAADHADSGSSRIFRLMPFSGTPFTETQLPSAPPCLASSTITGGSFSGLSVVVTACCILVPLK